MELQFERDAHRQSHEHDRERRQWKQQEERLKQQFSELTTRMKDESGGAAHSEPALRSDEQTPAHSFWQQSRDKDRASAGSREQISNIERDHSTIMSIRDQNFAPLIMQFQEFRTGADGANEHGLHIGQMTPGLADDPNSRRIGTMPQTMPNSIRSGELTSQSQGISAYNFKDGHFTDRGAEAQNRRRETFGPVQANTAQRQLHQLLQTPGTQSSKAIPQQTSHLIGGT